MIAGVTRTLRPMLRLAYRVTGGIPIAAVRTEARAVLLKIRRMIHKPGGRELELVSVDGGQNLSVNVCEQLGGDLYYGLGFEAAEIELFRALIQPGWTVFDVGANVGIYTILSAAGVGPTGHVYAFEPVPDVRQILLDNLSRAGAANVTIAGTAVSDAPGEVELFVNEETALTSIGRTGRGKIVAVRRVPVCTLDAYASDRGVSRIDLLKIDVEGFEGHVLRGAEGLLERSRDVVIFSELAEKNFRPLNLSREDVFRWLKARAFEAWEFDRDGVRVRKLSEPWERSPNQNFLFVRPETSAERLVIEKVREMRA